MNEIFSSVIITTYKDDHRLGITLTNFLQQMDREPFEVIVVNDGGPSSTEDIVRRALQEVRYIGANVRYAYFGPPSEKVPYRLAAAWNYGSDLAQGDQLIFCNCDTAPMWDMVGRMQRQYQPNEMIVGVRKFVRQEAVEALKDWKDGGRDWLFQNAYRDDDRLDLSMEEGRRFKRLSVDPEPWRVAWGCLLAIPANRFRKIGGFDEEFVGWGGEDEDLVRRLWRDGLKVVPNPEAFVYHLDHPRRTSVNSSHRFHERFNYPIVRNGGPRARYTE